MGNSNNKTWIGHISCFTAYFIFGINIVSTKDLAEANAFSPLCIFSMRALVATSIFWMLDLIHGLRQGWTGTKVEWKDLPKIFAASMLGLFLTQLSFLIGITMTTPLDWGILTVLGPIFTMFIAAIVLKEPITVQKAGGVAISFAGVVVLILNSTHSGGAASTSVGGILLALLNCLSFAMYLGIFRPLIQKYRVVTFMKWMFLFSLAVSLPFTAKEICTTDYAAVPLNCYLELGYLIIFATIVAYFLIPVGQKHIRPTIVSLYSYLQPVVAAAISIIIGMDVLSWQKVLAALAIVGGVVLVNKSRSKI